MTKPLPEDSVLIRTAQGHREVLVEGRDLDDSGRRMLLMVNGFTPLSNLVDRLSPATDWQASAWSLLEEGLVSVVEPLPEQPSRT